MKDDALLGFLVALVVAALLTPVVARLARRVGAVDDVKERGLAREATPLLGGLAIFAAVIVAALLFMPMTQSVKGILSGAALITRSARLDAGASSARAQARRPCDRRAGVVLSGVSVDIVTLPFLGRASFGTAGDVLTLLGSSGS